MKKSIHYSDIITRQYTQTIELDVPEGWKPPNYASEETPLTAPKGKVNFLDATGNWQLIDDPNYVTVYSTTTGKEILVPKTEVPADVTPEKKPSTKHIYFEGKWLLDSEIREILYQRKYDEINTKVSEKVVGGYESNVTGQTLVYDSAMHDQQNIKTMADLGIDRKLRVKKDGVKTSVPHANEQLKKLVEDFAQYVIEKIDQGIIKKDTLTISYLTMPLEDLKNFDTDIL